MYKNVIHFASNIVIMVIVVDISFNFYIIISFQSHYVFLGLTIVFARQYRVEKYRLPFVANMSLLLYC